MHVCITETSLCRVYELAVLYNIFIVGGQMEFCPENENQDDVTNGTNITRDDTNDDVKTFTDVAKYVTFVSVCIEVGLGYFTFHCFLLKFSCCTEGVACSSAWGGFARNRLCLCCFHSESYLEGFTKAITPFLMCDAILFLTVAPISNVHPFVVTCVGGYILTGLRLASYVLTFVLLFGFRYYKYNDFKLKGVAPLLFDFIGLFLVLFSVSSSLATLINLGIPETKSIRVSYAVATFVIVIITYIKYYTAIDAMRVETANKKTECRESCYEVINHITFWFKLLFGDIVLIVLNLIIWTQHFEDDIRYAGLSLISTVLSTLFGSVKYFAVSPFCRVPLYKRIHGKDSSYVV